jgi:hypothetical protein
MDFQVLARLVYVAAPSPASIGQRYETQAAHLDTAFGGFSLSPPAKRGERVGERGTNATAHEGKRLSGMTASSPQPSPPEEEREIESPAGGSVKMRPYGELPIRALMGT